MSNISTAGNKIANLPTLPNPIQRLSMERNRLTDLFSLWNLDPLEALFYSAATKAFTNGRNPFNFLYSITSSASKLTQPPLPNLIHFDCCVNRLSELPMDVLQSVDVYCAMNHLIAKSCPILSQRPENLRQGDTRILVLASLPNWPGEHG
jgi:hypothetical protein